MKTHYVVRLTALILAIGLNQPNTSIQTSPSFLNVMLNDGSVQRSPLSFSLQADQTSTPPPVDGRPDNGRTPAGTRITADIIQEPQKVG